MDDNLTGRALYDIYASALGQLGVLTDTWRELDPEMRAAWDRTAQQVRRI